MQDTENFTPQLTADGSYTFFSAEFGQTFHSHFGARQEAEQKFVQPLQLARKAQQPVLRLLDICYGLGYNTAAALATIWAVNPDCCIEWVGLELDPTAPKAAISHHLLNQWPAPIPQLLTQLTTACQLKTERLQAQLLVGDARHTIQQVCQSGFLADAIFLDPFSPPSCPQLWTVEFLSLVANCLHPLGLIATYSCSAAVRSALISAGLNIASTSPVGRRSPGTVAGKHDLFVAPYASADLLTLSQQEQEHLQTRAAIPYRDPLLRDGRETIIGRRLFEQQASPLELTSHWKKRWCIS